MNLRIILFVICVTSIVSCSETSTYKKDDRIERWYDKLKKEINTNAEKTADSVEYRTKDKTLYITYFNNGNKTMQEYRTLDTSRVFARFKYGENDLFELRSEVYEDGTLATEGIVYNNDYYGPWTVRFVNGQVMYRGYRYQDEDFGDWIYYSEDGERDSLVKKGSTFLADSILKNKSLHTTKPKLH